jgi:hypothetical protein
MSAQHYYNEQGHGIEMLCFFINKSHPLDNRSIQNIISSMQSLTFLDTEDWHRNQDKLENYNLRLSWVGQEMSPSFLIHLAQMKLSKSFYAKDIKYLQLSHTASGTSFVTLGDPHFWSWMLRWVERFTFWGCCCCQTTPQALL